MASKEKTPKPERLRHTAFNPDRDPAMGTVDNPLPMMSVTPFVPMTRDLVGRMV